jgi:hypothetical protein
MRSSEDLGSTSTGAEVEDLGSTSTGAEVEEVAELAEVEEVDGSKYVLPDHQEEVEQWQSLKPFCAKEDPSGEHRSGIDDHSLETNVIESGDDPKDDFTFSVGPFVFGLEDGEKDPAEEKPSTWKEFFGSTARPLRWTSNRLRLKELPLSDARMGSKRAGGTRRRSSASTLFSSVSGEREKPRRASTATLRSVEGTCGKVAGTYGANSLTSWLDDDGRSASRTDGMSKLYGTWSHSTTFSEMAK